MTDFDEYFKAAALDEPLLHSVVAMQTHARKLAEMYQIEWQPLLPGYDELLAGVAKVYQLNVAEFVDFVETEQPDFEVLKTYVSNTRERV